MAFNASAQVTSTTTKPVVTKSVLDKNSVVKDAAGYFYPYAIWQKLLQGGDHALKRISTDNNGGFEFVLYEMTVAQKLKSLENKKASILNMPQPRVSDAFTAGEKFKGVKIIDINGNKFDLKTLSNKIYVLNFWFINCPPCKLEIPELNDLVEKYKDNPNVVFLAIALDEKFELKEFLKTTTFNYNIVDAGRYYAEKYGVKSYPTHVIIGKDGLIKFSTVGLAANTVFWVDKIIKEQL